MTPVGFLVSMEICFPIGISVPASVAIAAVIAVVAVFVGTRGPRSKFAVMFAVAGPIVESVLAAHFCRPSPSFFPMAVMLVEECIGRHSPV
jgi:hypothetical protein